MPSLNSPTSVPNAPPARRWRFLHTSPDTGAMNMALDEALMGRARLTREWVLRIYGWSAPTLSLGRNQTADGRYDRSSLAEHGVDVVRRPTGGRAILHHREITYSVTAPLANAGDLRESYGRINRLLLAGLRALGVDASLVEDTGREIPPGSAPCFDHPSAGELVVDARKLVGSAQWRHDGALLQHGSVLLEDDQAMLASLMTTRVPSSLAPATLRAVLGRSPEASEVASALIEAIRREGDDLTPLTACEIDDLAPSVSSLHARYVDEAWTWRR
jgi:lipoyl(octanoyl) transferase